jgi:hypothetical protein
LSEARSLEYKATIVENKATLSKSGSV